MPLPSTFTPWEHLQGIILQLQNRRVRDEFNDVGPDDWDENITTSRASLRVACTLRDDDSAMMTLIRLWLFDIILKGASSLHPAIYGIPSIDFQETVKFHPQVTLHFTEDTEAVPDESTPIRAEISYRLVNETAETMTPAKATSLANEIKNTFATSGGYRWRKGHYKINYTDQKRGYFFRVLAYNEAEGREVIQRVLSLNEHTLNDDLLSISETRRPLPTTPGNQLVYGKQRRKPRDRPIGYVRFRYAQMDLHGLPESIVLVDRTGFHKRAIVRA